LKEFSNVLDDDEISTVWRTGQCWLLWGVPFMYFP